MIPSGQISERTDSFPAGGNRLGKRSLWWYLSASPWGGVILVGIGVGALWIVLAHLPTSDTPPFPASAHPTPAPPTPAQERAARRGQMRHAAVAFSLRAVELGTSLSADTQAAENAVMARYAGRILMVQGTVCEIFEDGDTQGVVLAGPRQYDQPTHNLRCEVLDRRELHALRLGQTVTVKGRFADLSSTPLEAAILTDCLLIPNRSAH